MLTRLEASALKKILPQRLLQIASEPGLHILQVRHKLQHISTSTNKYEHILTVGTAFTLFAWIMGQDDSLEYSQNADFFPLGYRKMPAEVGVHELRWRSYRMKNIFKDQRRRSRSGFWWNCIPNHVQESAMRRLHILVLIVTTSCSSEVDLWAFFWRQNISFTAMQLICYGRFGATLSPLRQAE